MKYEYELISHNYIRGFHLFLVRILYRTPHLHREFEVNLILDGSVEILSQGREYHAETGDFFVFDPYSADQGLGHFAVPHLLQGFPDLRLKEDHYNDNTGLEEGPENLVEHQ